MKNQRHVARESALQCLYLMDVCHLDVLSACGTVYTDDLNSEIRTWCRHWVEGVAEHKNEIDALLKQQAENWEMERMAAIDRNILRLATFEILHENQTPIPVILNEAIELAKTYSSQDSGKFVNGLLDKIKNKRK